MGLKSKKVDNESSDDFNSDGSNTEGSQANNSHKERDADFSNLGGSRAAASFGEDNGEVGKLTAELAEMKDKYLRALADFENLKKRAQKERSELLRYQGDAILVDLLEVLDSFERALELGTGTDAAKILEGLKMIHKQFLDALGKWEVRPDPAMGKDFDPNKHRAIAKGKGERSGVVIGELKKPYFYRDKLLRVGEVVVSEAEAAESTNSNG